ncbi:hypothetical protein [Corynebacterium godavarianum]|uniref:hypothetical protein n=1 Tax=Corynebacterium godavarianum TaxID=2054421 RepID=UPI001ABF5925|nr:hypothetical protein [Corynebacterium godavarianum]
MAVGFVMSAGFALSVDDFSRLLARYGHFVDMGTGSIFIGLALWMLGKGAVNAVLDHLDMDLTPQLDR